MLEFKRISKYEIYIRHTINGGCIVNIGCCEISFSNSDDMIDALKEYYSDPDGMEKKYNLVASNINIPTPESYSPRKNYRTAEERCSLEPANLSLRVDRPGPQFNESTTDTSDCDEDCKEDPSDESDK